MKSLKRILNLVLVAAMLMSMISITSVAALENYDAEIQFVTDLGITGFNKSTQTQTITRGEFALALAQAVGMEATYVGTDSFIDVDSTHASYNAVSYLKATNVVGGYGDGSFKPDQIITYEEALKTVTCALGYNDYAQAAGGYYVGYKKVASQFDVDITPADAANLTKGEAALMLYELLHANYLDIISINNGSISYAASEDTVMERVFGLEKKTGIVNATKFATVYGENVDSETEIVIGYEKYNTSIKRLNDFVGCSVDYYVDEDKNVKSILKSEDIVEYKIMSEDIMPSATATQFVYKNENKKEEKLNISGNADYVYNGRPISGSEAKGLIKPNYGEVRLIDNDNNKSVDVVIIWEYKPYYVEKVTELSTKMSNEFYDTGKGTYVKEEKIVTFNEDDKTLCLLSQGQFIEVLLFATDSVATYAESLDGTHRTIFTIQNPIEGVIEGCNSANGTVTIDGEIYDVVPGINVSEYIGKRMNIYFDSNGYVGYIKDFSGDKYGYLYALKSEGDFDKTFGLKLFDATGFKTFDFSESDKIDFGVGVVSEKISIDKLWEKITDGDGKIIKELVKYTLSEDGKKMTSLVLPEDLYTQYGSNFYAYTDSTRFQLCYSFVSDSVNETAKYYRRRFGIKDTFDGANVSYKAFDIMPGTSSLITASSDEEKCVFDLFANLYNTNGSLEPSNAKFYNMKDTGWYEFVTVDMEIEQEADWANREGTFAVITDITTVLDPVTEETKNEYSAYIFASAGYHLIGTLNISDGELEEAFNQNSIYEPKDGEMYTKSTLNDLEVGDIIAYHINNMTGSINLWAYLLKSEDFAKKISTNHMDHDNNVWNNAFYGEIKYVDSEAALLVDPEGTPDGEGIENTNFFDKDSFVALRSSPTSKNDPNRHRTSVLAYDEANNTYTAGKYTWDDLAVGMKVYFIEPTLVYEGQRIVIVIE